ncbi:hypothetical protein [Streptomyces microflavus]|uniref:hypothetical protein n=1 Tax=Streptomyces microflavus TaxID=1919 RepID=UPI0033B4372F
MRSRIRLVTFGALVAVAAMAGVVVAQEQRGDTDDGGAPESILVAHGKDRRPSLTAEDWVTYADHVVVATAVAERETPPAQIEIDRGEGLTGREVTLRIDRVVWSREGAVEPAPTEWKRASVGWQFSEGDTANRTKMAMEDQPRVEAGHRYILALDWEEATCSPGDEPEPAQWRTLGEGAVVPFDDQIIGRGEMEGRLQEPARAKAASAGPDTRLEDELAGRGIEELSTALKAARPGVTVERFGPPSISCA